MTATGKILVRLELGAEDWGGDRGIVAVRALGVVAPQADASALIERDARSLGCPHVRLVADEAEPESGRRLVAVASPEPLDFEYDEDAAQDAYLWYELHTPLSKEAP